MLRVERRWLVQLVLLMRMWLLLVDLVRMREGRRGRRVEDMVLIGMDGLDVLAQVVEPRKSAVAVTPEGPLTGVLANVPGQMLGPGEGHLAVAIPRALEDLGEFGFGLLGRRRRPRARAVAVVLHSLRREELGQAINRVVVRTVRSNN